MNCIFICVFNQEKYVDMFYLVLESLFIYGNLDNNTHILVYTSTQFMNLIKQSHLFNHEKIKFEINDTYDNIDKACKARLDLFNLSSISNYKKILYLDTDILVKDDISKLFDICNEDLLYVLEEGNIDHNYDCWGNILFGDEINNYDDKTAFTSGILLFNHCEKIKDLFQKINEDIVNRPFYFSCFDQPYIIYNAFKYNVFNNKILKSFAVNNDYNIHSDKVIHHFPGGPGNYGHKIEKMTVFLNNMKEHYKVLFIHQIISNAFTMVSKERLTNLYNQCKKFNNTDYSLVECGVAKGGCLSMMKFASGKNNKIFGFDSFEGMPPITNEDLGSYNKCDPNYWVGKINEEGINSVYNTFDKLNLNMDNVTLVKGFFEDTINDNMIDQLGEIAVLRLDNYWYTSTKFCLEKLYDKVIDGGIILIDDYGCWIGAKRAVDEFRNKNNILEPLLQSDNEEHYWVKKKYTDLCILGYKYAVDKCPFFGNHTYTPQYHKLLHDIRNNVEILLEIGIGNIPLMKNLTNSSYKPGASLRMWRDYFLNANIIGCDILESVLFSEERISTFILDQSNEESLKNLIDKIEKKVDVIIDDGSHIQEHMVKSFNILWKIIKPNGLYIIEDIHISFFDRIMNLNKELSFFDAECIMSYKGKFVSDNFIVFKKTSIIFDNRNEMLQYYCDKLSNPKLVEIGVFKGEFLDFLVKKCNIGSIDAIDLFDGVTCSGDVDGNDVVFYDVGKSYLELTEKYKDISNVRVIKSNSITFLQNQQDDTYDIIYIDGDHSYNGVKNDLINAYSKIKNGGYIMGHDYEMNLNKAKNSYQFGTKKAVDEFCINYKQNIISKAIDGCVSFCIRIYKN